MPHCALETPANSKAVARLCSHVDPDIA